jgi:hypothetical protein
VVRQIELKINNGLIDANLVNLETVKKTKVLTGLSEDQLRQYYQSKVLDSKPQIFPPAVRYISRDRTRLIWERPPGYQSINYSAAKQEKLSASSKSMNLFRIPVPWQVYFICFNEEYVINTMYMFFNNHPLTALNKSVGYAPLNNFYKDSKLCQAVYDRIPEANNLFQMLDNAYNMVWNSGFNEDLHECIDQAFAHNRSSDHPLFNGNIYKRRVEYYSHWASLDLDAIASASWPLAAKDVLQLANNYSHASNNIRVVQFLTDAQSA